MRKKLVRTFLSVLAVVGVVLAARWTIRAAVTRAYPARRDVGAPEMPVVPAPRVHSLAGIVPESLRVNIAGLAVRRHAERLHMPYSLAVGVADERAKSLGWERLDNANALTIKNLSGMERVYKTPAGAIVLREVRALRGNDALMEDFEVPADLIPEQSEQTTPDALARRAAQQVKAQMPGVLRDVVVGSPLLTELVERGGGAAFIVHCVAETAAEGTARAIEAAARRTGWTETRYADVAAGPEIPAGARGRLPRAAWTKQNLTFHYEIVPRAQGGGCDVDYRFTDDEAYISTKGHANEN